MRPGSEPPPGPDFSAYPWRSDTVYAAELDADGVIIRANSAMERSDDAADGGLRGVAIDELLSREQVAAFRAWADGLGPEWAAATFGFQEAADGSAGDRQLWMRRLEGGHLEMIAEPAWTEHRRLVEQVLQLNDDLIGTQRRLTRRQRQLEQAQDEAARAALRVRQLERVLMAGLSPSDFDQALRMLLAAAQELLPGDRADILLLDETRDRLVVRASAGEGAFADAGTTWGIGEGAVGVIAANGVPELIEDLRTVVQPDGRRREGSLIGVPLTLENQVIGVLASRAAMPGSFDGSDLRLLELVGERVALAIGQAQLRERERGLAETLQRTLLPQRLPEVPGVELAVRYIARTASVGGDFYDAMPLPDGRIGLAVGDVTGKGLRSAATMGRLGGALHAYALDAPDPAQVLHRVGRLAEADGALATALFLALDPVTGSYEVASAGHPPPLCVDGDGARYLDLGDGISPLLGLAVDHRGQARRELSPGATLILFTDGLVERTHDIEEGLAQLAAAASSAAAQPLEELCDHLLEMLAPAGRYRDDVAILAVRRL